MTDDAAHRLLDSSRSSGKQQRLDNPHSEDANPNPGDADYEAYAQGWYDGYALHFLVSIYYGGAVTEGVTEGANVGQRVSRVADDVATSPALRADGSGLKSAQIANRLANEGYDDLGQQFRTAGKEAQAVNRVSQVDSAVLNRLNGEQRTELVRHLGEAPNGHRVLNDLGPERTNQLFDLSFTRADAEQFRANIIRHGDTIGDQRLGQYIDDVTAARSSDSIQNSERLVTEAADEGIPASQIRGQAGEARSAVQYADTGADVIVEPGRTEAYDLAVTRSGRTEYVEVKTRAPTSNVDERWVSTKIDEMNNKYNNARADPDIDVTNNERVLEIRTSSDTSNLELARSETESALTTRQMTGSSTEIDEIRLVSSDGTKEPVAIDSQP
ncbi:hypothetical protein [Natrarchaeobaculum sulfurireducens]|uniref:Uncharacterized protein n=1 Tax=Natrarchaeobaculum sulfurireducens TaxID=2044521 RepID=A0A346PUT5_9EURY|nr:hypothetical protein [Natrarchaeobaculum sulfurireducens]AXR83280.1 hypothetical protein AArcMg_3296 [Natrarchaeobaculum sulfurireducens]